MSRNTPLFAALAIALVLAAGGAAAQDGRWMIGLDGLSSHIGDNDDEPAISVDEQAGGGALQVGYRFSPTFMLRLYGGGADHGTSDPDIDIRFMSSFLEGVFLFGESRPFRPYLFGGLGGFQLESQQGDLLFEANGAGISFGAGAHYLVGRSVSLHGSLRLEAVNWDKASVTYEAPDGSTLSVETPVDDSGFASKLTLGVAFWF